jgi:signal transduction histidine kinase
MLYNTKKIGNVMPKIALFFRWLSLVFFISLSVYASDYKHVLIINSYPKNFQWSDDLIAGIDEIFEQEHKIDSTIIYMDGKRISSDAYYRSLRDLLKIQLKDRSYDLVILVDRFAYDFALRYYHELFINERLLFSGMEQFSLEEARLYGLEEKISGVLERRAIEDIVKTIDAMMPQLKKLTILNDTSANGDDTEPFIKKAIKDVRGKFSVEYIREATMDELKEKFATPRENEAVFFVRFYNGKYNQFYKNSEIASMLDASKVPMFVTDSLFMTKGALGGKLLSIHKIGIDTGRMALSILKNPTIPNVITTQEEYEYVFDYQKIQTFKLMPSLLGQPYELVNAPLSFFDTHRELINTVFLISPLLILLIVELVRNLFLRIKSSKLLQQRILLDKILLNAIENPIVWENSQGYIVDTNTQFCELLHVDSTSIKGKKLEALDRDGDNLDILIRAIGRYSYNADTINEIILKDAQKQNRTYLLKITSYVEKNGKTEGSVMVLVDITREKLLQEDKSKHQEFVIQQAKLAEIGEVFSSIAHQWKSPLVEIATIAQEELYHDAIEQTIHAKSVDEIMVQVQYMTDTINDFQSFIMPSSAKSVFDVKNSIQTMLKIIQHDIKYNYIDVTIDTSKASNLRVLGYKNEFMQTLLNIVNNAKEQIKSFREVKKIKRGTIKISIHNEENKIVIVIEDNGGGIAEEKLPYVFDAYFTTKEKGHGIGLYMSKLIIENKMGGKIEVKNHKEGAAFMITLESYHETTVA